MNLFILCAMIFCHILDDYTLQGWLADAKQKQWWKVNAPDPMYKYDYIMALIMHSLSWSFMIMLPIAIYFHFNVNVIFIVVFILNSIIHCIVDDLKANKHKVNLIQDQIIHLLQVLLTYIIFLIK